MKTLEQVIRLLEELQRKFTSHKSKLEHLEELSEQQLAEARRALAKSERAQDIALHTFRVDHNGFIWRWDNERKEYVKTKARVNMPVIPDESIKAHQIADEAIEERHLSKGLIAWLREFVLNVIGANEPNGHTGSCNVFMTQEEYDSLEDKDEHTTYFIYEEDGGDEPGGGGGGDEPSGPDEPGEGDEPWRLGDRMPLVLE